VCEQLPLEPLYLNWLVFAAADSETWRQAVLLAVKEPRLEILNLARAMHLKEYEAMGSQINLLFDQYSPQERERLKRDWLDMLKVELPRLAREDPDEMDEVLLEYLSQLPPEKREKLLKRLAQKTQNVF
jgi:hypothetical protein